MLRIAALLERLESVQSVLNAYIPGKEKSSFSCRKIHDISALFGHPFYRRKLTGKGKKRDFMDE